MKILNSKNQRKLIVVFVSFLLLFTSIFFGTNIAKASAAETQGVIQLSIYSQHGDGSSSSSSNVGLGHAWLVIENWTNKNYDFYNTVILAGETFSVGTWGNRKDPDTKKNHNGSWLNLEAYYQMGENSTASLTITISESQLATVSEKCISMNSWNAINNCSYFASKVWNAVAPKDMQVNSYFFPANFPSTLKKSIQKISGYQTNRAFAYNDYTGYCTSNTNFKYIRPDRIDSGSSSSSSSSSISGYYEVGYRTSFPAEYNSQQDIIDAYYQLYETDMAEQLGREDTHQ